MKMILHLLLILSTKLIELKSENALVFSPSLNEVEDICRPNIPGDELTFTAILACPASTQKEKQFDEKVSLTGHSLFFKEFHPKHELVENIHQDICDKSFEPVMVYDHTRDEYKIGYELYYDDTKVPEFNSCNGTCYHSYRLVQMKKNQTNHESKNQTEPSSDLVIKYEDGNKLKFNFTDGSQTLVFHWVDVLTLKSSGHNKRIVNSLTYTSWMYNLSNTCQYYNPPDQNIYSEQNQEIYLKDILQPSATNETNPGNISCGQTYGCLVNSQIGSLMHFLSSPERLASCSHLNMIPVWKTISEGQLLKVDAYTMALDALLIPHRKILGVSGVLKMRKASNPEEFQEIHLLSDSEHQKVLHVPKILYRIIEYHRIQCGNDVDQSQWITHKYAAAIIIHNDPSLVSDDQRLCDQKSSLSGGWQMIINNDPRTGITYVCPVTPELNDELGACEDSITVETFKPLNVDAVPYCDNLNNWDPEDKIHYLNYTTDILENFDEILANALAR